MSGRGIVRYCQACGTRLATGSRLTHCAPCQEDAVALVLGPPDVPAGFWDTDLMRDAADSWHIGGMIRAYRHHPHHVQRPLSQELVAGWLQLTQTQLSRIENGPPVKDLGRLIHWARTLKIPQRLLWFQLPGAYGHEVSPGSSADESLSARTFVPATRPHSQIVTGPPTASTSPDAAVMQAFRVADLQVGGGHLYATVVTYLQTAVAPRLFGTAASGSAVFAPASALTEMAGWMAHDAGRDVPARQHFSRALDLAKAGRDVQLSAHILASMSHLALHQGQPREAIHLARQGHEALGAAPRDPALNARLLAMEARGLAALPQPEPAACGQALARAERALDQEPAGQLSPWVSGFDEGSLASEAARCLYQLGRLEAAAVQAQRVVETRPESRLRSRAFGQLLLASVLVAQDEPERACVLAQQVLDATQSLSSFPILRQLHALARKLQPFQLDPAAAAFLASLRDEIRQRMWLYPWVATTGLHPGPTAEPSR